MTTISQTQSKPRTFARADAWRLILGVVLSSLSGVMFLLAFPPYGLWPLAWFGFVPALLAQYRFLPAKWTSLASAVFSAVWLGPFLARLFGPDFGPFFQYLGIWIAILNFLISKPTQLITPWRMNQRYFVNSWKLRSLARKTFRMAIHIPRYWKTGP